MLTPRYCGHFFTPVHQKGIKRVLLKNQALETGVFCAAPIVSCGKSGGGFFFRVRLTPLGSNFYYDNAFTYRVY